MNHSYKHSAGFGKRMEYFIIGLMLKEGLDVYIPLVDDDAIDAIAKRTNNTFASIQIKARSKSVVLGNGALFAGIPHQPRVDYWFIFYSERLDMIWIMTSDEFIKEARQNKSGKNKGLRTIWLNGKKKGVEYCKPQFEKYIANNFDRLK